MKLVSAMVFSALTAATPLSEDAQACLEAEECVIVRKVDLQRFLDDMKRNADSKVWCRNA